jgi:hypothetical protein
MALLIKYARDGPSCKNISYLEIFYREGREPVFRSVLVSRERFRKKFPVPVTTFERRGEERRFT